MTSEEQKIPPEEEANASEAAEETSEPKVVPITPQEDPLQKAQEEIAQLKDKLLRAVAEGDNIRKRAARDQEEMSKYAVTAFARDMVNVLENIQRASESIDALGDDKLTNVAEGLELTLRETLGIFEKFGIRRLDPLNQKFDHHLHQAVVQVERSDVPPGTVVQVVQAGYVIQDRLLRPAMVAVSKQGETAKQVDTTA